MGGFLVCDVAVWDSTVSPNRSTGRLPSFFSWFTIYLPYQHILIDMPSTLSGNSAIDTVLAKIAASNAQPSIILIQPYQFADNEQVRKVSSSSMRSLHPLFASALF